MNDDGSHELESAVIVSPPGWAAHEVVEFAAPDLSAHVIASVEPVAAGTTADDVARDYGTVLERLLPDYSEVSIEPVALADDRPAVMRVLRWTPEGCNEVTQIQVYSVEGRRACVGTATTQTAIFDRLEPDLRRTLESVRIDAPRGIGMPAVRGPVEEIGAHDGTTVRPVPVPSLAFPAGQRGSLPVDDWSSVRERFSDA